MVDWSSEQVANARTIVTVGREKNATNRDIVIALMTAMQESTLRNLSGGDRDSAGLFQQRPSQGWGTHAQVTNARYAAGKFYDHLFSLPDRQSMSLTQAAQAVQKSAFPDAYAKWERDASELFVKVNPGGIPIKDTTGAEDIKEGVAGMTNIVPEEVGDFFSAATSVDLWKRVGVVAAGVVITIAGASIMLTGSKTVKDGISAVAGVASKGVIK